VSVWEGDITKVCEPGYRPKGFSYSRFAVGEVTWSILLKKSPIAVALSAFAIFNLTAFNSTAVAQQSDSTIETVNITSKRGIRPVLDVLADTTVIDRGAIESSAATNLIDLLQGQAGLEVTQQGGQGKLSGLFLRGTKTAQTLIIIDGVRLENPLSGGANLEFIPLASIERIEISRGPASSFYGSAAMGGVIQIFTRQNSDTSPAGVRTFGSFSLGSNSTVKANAGVSGTDQSTRWMVSIARDQTKGFEATLPSSTSYQQDRDGNRQNAVNISASHQIIPTLQVGFNGFVTKGRTFYDSSFSAPDDTRLDYRTTSLSGFLKGQLSNAWGTELRVGKTGITYDYYDASGLFPFAPKADTLNLAWTNQFKLGDSPSAGALFGGVETSKQTVTGPGVSSGLSVYGATARRINSVFGGYETRIDSHTVRLQLRNDSIHSEGAALSSKANTGTVAYGYTVSKEWQFRASAGSAFRAPTFDDLYNPFGPNPTLKPEKSVGYELGVEYRDAMQAMKVAGFSQKIRQAIELDSSFVSQNYDSAKVNGATIEATRKLGAFRLRGNVTLQDTEGSYTDFATGNTVVGSLARRANLHGSIALNWLDTAANSNQRTGWKAGAQWQFQGHRGDTDGSRLAGYGVVNLSTSYGFFGNWSAFGKLGNVFDRQYQLASGYRATPRYLMIGVSYN
jgi:vitamin B12 transporter